VQPAFVTLFIIVAIAWVVLPVVALAKQWSIFRYLENHYADRWHPSVGIQGVAPKIMVNALAIHTFLWRKQFQKMDDAILGGMCRRYFMFFWLYASITPVFLALPIVLIFLSK
jgi:hypothetical protein